MYTFFSDAGHGWLKVKRQELIDLNILDKITVYSYQKGAYVYLEEDQDAYTFINAFKERFGFKPQYKESVSNRSTIRSYEPFSV